MAERLDASVLANKQAVKHAMTEAKDLLQLVCAGVEQDLQAPNTARDKTSLQVASALV